MLLAAVAVAGCSSCQPWVTEERLDKGLVIVLPGVEGRSMFNDAICAGLDAGGVDCAIETDDWTSPLGPLATLGDEQRNRAQAERIAERIVEYQQAYPDRPVVLVGQSGGAAMAPWVAEALPDATMIDGMVLIAPALSPWYPLTEALGRSRRGIVSFHSEMDWLFLGVGTSLLGTMDGERLESAGKVGFVTPLARDEAAYEKLYQVPWNRSMARNGHLGCHVTSGSLSFVKKRVAPLVLSDDWAEQTAAE